MTALATVWGLLNIALAIAVFFVFYRNFRIYAERYGNVSTGSLFLLTVAMCHSPRKNTENGPNPAFAKSLVCASRLRAAGFQSYTVKLADLGLSAVTQSITVHPDPESDSAQITSVVYLTGMTSGLIWTPLYSSVSIDPAEHLQYTAAGTIQWCLLGIPLYTQLKQFSGPVPEHRLKAY